MSRKIMSSTLVRRLYRIGLATSFVGLLAVAPGCPSGSSGFAPPPGGFPNPFNTNPSHHNAAPAAPGLGVGTGNVDVTGMAAKGLIKPPTEDMSCDEAWKKLKDNENVAGWADFVSTNHQFSREALTQSQSANASQQLAGKLPLEALESLVEDGAREVADSLPATPEIKKAQRKQVLVVGKFENDVAANKELDYALAKLKTRLNKQNAIKDNFVVVGMSEQAGENALKKAGAGQAFEFTDPLDPTAVQGPTKYNPKTIYAISGRMIESRDDQAHRMYLKMSIDVTHSATRTLVDTHEVTAEYRYHPARNKWISQAEDEALAKARGRSAKH